MAPPPKTVPHAPTKKNQSRLPPTGGLTVSPESKISASDLMTMIKGSQKIPDWMKGTFYGGGNRILVMTRFRLPDGVTIPHWFDLAAQAINSGAWHLTTGASNVDRSALFMGEKILGDYEEHDIPAGGGRTGGIVAGETVPTLPAGSSIGLRKMEDQSASGGPGSLLRRPPTDTKPGEGLIVVANRFRDTRNPSAEVGRADDSILESLFHELAAHAELINEGKDSDHNTMGIDYYTSPITDADQLAKDVHDFFSPLPDETPLMQQAAPNVWDRIKDGLPPVSRDEGSTGNVWDRAK